MRAGYAVGIITPDKSVGLAGLGPGRFGESVLDDLRVRILVLDDGSCAVALLSFDMLYVTRALAEAVELRLASRLPDRQSAVLTAATHTHSGPALWTETFDGTPADRDVISAIEAKALKTLDRAVTDLQAVTASDSAIGMSDFAVHRRRRILDRQAMGHGRIAWIVANRPNLDGTIDRAVRGFRIIRADGSRIAIVQATGHPSLLRGNAYSGDYPGRVEGALRSEGLADHVLFFQGFCGDVRVNLTRRLRPWPPRTGRLFDAVFDAHQFRKDASPADTDEVASRIAEALVAAWRPVELGPLSWTMQEVALPLDREKPRPDITARLDTNDVLAPVACRIGRLSLGRRIHMFTMEGEPFSSYALWLQKRFCANAHGASILVLPIGYAGGCKAYLPDTIALREGGYEVERSLAIFDLPARFHPSLETILKSNLERLADGFDLQEHP